MIENTFLLSQRRSTQDILDRSKIQKIHHILYQWCVETTHLLMEEHHTMMALPTIFIIVWQHDFCTVKISL